MALDIIKHNETVLATLEEGDLVEFPRGLISHWGVYVGNEYIVHLGGVDFVRVGVDSLSSSTFTKCGTGHHKASVKKEKFLIVAGDSKAKKNNDKDKTTRPLSVEIIKETALSKLGSTSYNLLQDNCEHFAASCRYGIKISQQVDTAMAVVSGTVVATVGGIACKAITSRNNSTLGPTSYNATNFENVTAGGRNEIPVLPQANGATSWFSVGLAALVGVGKLCYHAYTGGNDRRSLSTSYSPMSDYFADGRESNWNTSIGDNSNLNAFIREFSTSNSPMWNNFGGGTGIGIHSSGRFCFDQRCRTGACAWK